MTQMPTEQVRPPFFNVPLVILLVLGLLALVHGLRQLLPDANDVWVVTELSFVPARATLQFDPAWIVTARTELADNGPAGVQEAQVAQYLLGEGDLKPWTFLTYAALHADLAHLGLNAFWLLAFGSAVARRFGGLRFGGFFVVTAIAGALAHWAAHPAGFAPVIGASAAVSGAMAGAARFAFQPGGPLQGFVPRGDNLAFQLPALPLTRVLTDRRVLPFLMVWFIINLVTGIGAVPLGMSDSGIAWEAHVGGFVAGLLLFDLFDPFRN